MDMNWQLELCVRVQALGDKPNQEQIDMLEGWILDNVPSIEYGKIWHTLPRPLSTDFSMRAAELGYFQ
jgi:hypothetical protein